MKSAAKEDFSDGVLLRSMTAEDVGLVNVFEENLPWSEAEYGDCTC